MDTAILIASLVLAWPVCLLLAGLVACAGTAYAYGLPARRLAQVLEDELAVGDRPGITPLSLASRARLVRLEEQNREFDPALRDQLDSALAVFTGSRDTDAYLERLAGERHRHQEAFLTSLTATARTVGTLDLVIAEWRMWLLAGRLRLAWLGLAHVGPQIARNVVGVALTATATAGLVAVLGSLFLWLLVPGIGWSGQPLLQFAGAGADVGLLVGLVAATVTVFRRFWRTFERGLPADRRRGVRWALGLGLLLFPANGIAQHLDLLGQGSAWLGEHLPELPDGQLPPTLVATVASVALAAGVLLRAYRAGRLAAAPVLPASQRLDLLALAIGAAGFALGMVIVAWTLVRPSAQGASAVQPLIAVVVGGGMLLAGAVMLAALGMREVEEHRRVRAWQDAGLEVEPMPSPWKVGAAWAVLLVLLVVLIDVLDPWSSTLVGGLLSILLALGVIGTSVWGGISVRRAHRERAERDRQLEAEYRALCLSEEADGAGRSADVA
ncbi:hypothetical protein ACI789_15370 [Geodermatophilus sp. SYSU D00965]